MKNEIAFQKWLRYVNLLKWAQVLAPAFLFLLIDILWQALSSANEIVSPGFIATHMTIAAAIVLMSYVTLTLINKLQQRITQQIHNQIIAQDRERIAREMHDGTAQVLGYISTQTIAAKKMLADSRFTEVRDELTNMGEVVHDLYSDVREGILGLRASAVRTGTLLTNLREYASHYTEMSGIQVEIQAPADTTNLRLSPSAEMQVMRIIQEALTNVRKHAKAKTTTITFECNNDKLNITIADEGQGFELTRLVPTGCRFGIQAMQERAQAIGGDFSITAAPGEGCRVSLCLPLSYSHAGKVKV